MVFSWLRSVGDSEELMGGHWEPGGSWRASWGGGNGLLYGLVLRGREKERVGTNLVDVWVVVTGYGGGEVVLCRRPGWWWWWWLG